MSAGVPHWVNFAAFQVGWFFFVIPVSFAAMLLVGVEILYRDLLSLLNPTESFEIPGSGEIVEGE